MLRSLIALVLLSMLSMLPGYLEAQTRPYVSAVTNSASYATSSIAQGSIFTIFGFDLGPDRLQQAGSYPLPPQIGGFSIKVTAGGVTLNCPMLYASNYQAAAILPSATPLGQATLTVTSGNLTSGGSIFQVAASAFGAYTTSSSGIGPGIVTGTDYALKTFANSAHTGETLILWGTGLGATSGPDDTVPKTTHQYSGVSVFVGTASAKIIYAGRSGCCAGLDQIAFEVPSGSLGCFVPIAVRTAGKVVSNFTTLPVNTSGGPCSSAAPGIPTTILTRAVAGETLQLGAIAIGPIPILQGAGVSFSQGVADQLSGLLHRTVSEADVRMLMNPNRRTTAGTINQMLRTYGIDPRQVHGKSLRTLEDAVSIDHLGAVAVFGAYSNLAGFGPLFGAYAAPSGTCTVINGLGTGGSDPRSRSLDAGSALSFISPLGAGTMTRVSNGQYQLSLGSGLPPILPAGTYTVSGTGGSTVPAFSASLRVTNPIAWTNKLAVTTVDRTVPLTVTWTGGPASGYVLIGGSARGIGGSTFLCVEQSARGTFTVPSFVLSALPPAQASQAYFFIAPHPFSNIVSIDGVDLAYIINGSSDYTQVTLR